MITYFDNFLPDADFSALNERMLKRYKPGMRQDDGPEGTAIRIRTTCKDGIDYTESKVLLGLQIVPALEKMRNTLVDLGYKDLLPYSIWYQYGDKFHSIGKHFDGSVRSSTLDNSISTFLYTNKYWENDWGGEFCVNGTKVLPKPNRLVVYSRDEEHWINDIKHTLDDGYMRMFFGVSWGTL
jgi:hypothetical protein